MFDLRRRWYLLALLVSRSPLRVMIRGTPSLISSALSRAKESEPGPPWRNMQRHGPSLELPSYKWSPQCVCVFSPTGWCVLPGGHVWAPLMKCLFEVITLYGSLALRGARGSRLRSGGFAAATERQVCVPKVHVLFSINMVEAQLYL